MYHCTNHPPESIPIMKHSLKKWIVLKLNNIAYQFEWFALELRKWADKVK